MRGEALCPVAEGRRAAGMCAEIPVPEVRLPGAGAQQHQGSVRSLEGTGAETASPGGGAALRPGRTGAEGYESIPRLFPDHQ